MCNVLCVHSEVPALLVRLRTLRGCVQLSVRPDLHRLWRRAGRHLNHARRCHNHHVPRRQRGLPGGGPRVPRGPRGCCVHVLRRAHDAAYSCSEDDVRLTAEEERETERQRDRERERERQRQRQTDRETQRDRERETHTQRERDRERNRQNFRWWPPPASSGRSVRSSGAARLSGPLGTCGTPGGSVQCYWE